jgi:hypothetical protein
MPNVINATSTGNGGLITQGDDSGILNIQTNETTAITVDASQRVGIGTTSPSNILDIVSASNPTIRITDTTNNCYTELNATDTVGYVGTASNHAFAFTTNNTERMRIDSSGNLLVGTTAPFNLNSAGSGTFQTASSDGQLFLRNSGASANFGWYLGANSSNQMRVYNQSGSGVLLTNGSTSWSSTSDERLKTDLAPIQDSLQKVSALRAVTGRFKTDEEGVSRSFLIAQDFESVFPQALDASDEDALSLKYTEVIPLLVASIKELKAMVDSIQSEFDAYKATHP